MGKAFFLLVDDDHAVRATLRRFVERFVKVNELDAEVVSADSGARALDLTRDCVIREPEALWCLITDYDMAGMSGSELIDAADVLLGEKLLLRLVLTGLIGNRRAEIEAKGALIDEKPFGSDKITSYLKMFQEKLSR